MLKKLFKVFLEQAYHQDLKYLQMSMLSDEIYILECVKGHEWSSYRNSTPPVRLSYEPQALCPSHWLNALDSLFGKVKEPRIFWFIFSGFSLKLGKTAKDNVLP